jgi:hypothetical protein
MNNFIWFAGSACSLPIFVFLGWILSGALKTAEQARRKAKCSNAPNNGILRRRIETNPNIICGFPIQQQARNDAPLF